MHPVHLIAQAILSSNNQVEIPQRTQPGVCAVTGEYGETVSRKTLFGKSFTDGAMLSAPGSDRVGIPAYIALTYKWERMGSWICDGKTFKRLNRQGVRQEVLGLPPTCCWTAYATTSYKKHGCLRAKVNAPGHVVWLYESRLVDCSDRKKLHEIWVKLNDALRLGLGRTVLESLVCPSWLIRKAGMAEWMVFEEWARPLYKSALYAFLCYLLPSQEELKDKSLRRY